MERNVEITHRSLSFLFAFEKYGLSFEKVFPSWGLMRIVDPNRFTSKLLQAGLLHPVHRATAQAFVSAIAHL
jgi:hypothetical protein